MKDFWQKRAEMDSFLWGGLEGMNCEITARYMPEGGRLLDLGRGDGSSSRGFGGVLVDYVRPKSLILHPSQQFVQSDIRNFSTDEKFDVITLYGVANFFDEASLEKLYHKCYAWLKPDGVLLVKHQCGKTEDVIVDGRSESLGENYTAYYLSKEKHVKMLRRAGFIIGESDPYPPEYNKWPNTEFKLFACQRDNVAPQPTYQADSVMDNSPRGNTAKFELLSALKRHLDSHNIPFYLMFGTLLGAKQNGDFIPWDTDIDIAILDRFQDRLRESMKNSPLKLWRSGEYYCSLTLGSEYVDVYTYTDEGSKYSYCGGLRRYFDEEKRVFDNWSEIEFKGMKFRTVENPEQSLERWYGKDWRTPKSKRIPSESDAIPDRFE